MEMFPRSVILSCLGQDLIHTLEAVDLDQDCKVLGNRINDYYLLVDSNAT